MALTRGVLGRAVGIGGDNDRDDVIRMKRLMQDVGLYDPPPEGVHDAIDADFDRAIRDFQEKSGLKVDGLMRPGGETERNLLAHATGEGFDSVDPDEVALKGDVGPGGKNDPEDVAAIKRTMGALGRYRYDRTRPPPPYIDGPLVAAIADFQREAGLFDDGLIAPDGETLPALREALGARQRTNGPRDGAGHARTDQVAAVQALPTAAAAAAAAAVASRLAPYVPRILGLGVGAVASQAVIDAARRKPPPPASSFLTPFSALPPDFNADLAPHSNDPPKVEAGTPPYPAKPIELPTHTEFPIPDDPGVLIEVYPNQSDEFNVPQIYESSRGTPKLEKFNTEHAGAGNEVIAEDELPVKHTHGAYSGKNERLNELYMPNIETGGRKGSTRPDVTFENTENGRRLFINTTDTGADGVTMTTRELNSAIRIIVNGNSGDILMTSPKLGKGQKLNLEALKEFLRPLLHEICKPVPKIDPRSKKAPEQLIRRWFPPKK